MPYIHHPEKHSTFPYICSYFLERHKALYIILKSHQPSFFPCSFLIVTTILKLEYIIPCLFLHFYYIYGYRCLDLRFPITSEFEHIFRYLLAIQVPLLFISFRHFFIWVICLLLVFHISWLQIRCCLYVLQISPPYQSLVFALAYGVSHTEPPRTVERNDYF